MELSTMGGRRLTSQQLQQLQQAHQQQQQQHLQQQQQQQFQHQYQQQQSQPAAMLFQQQQQHHHPGQQIQPPPPAAGLNPLHRSAPRFHASRHRKDSLGKSGGIGVGKYMYPPGGTPGSPSMGFAENIYHPQTTNNSSANSLGSAGNGKQHIGGGSGGGLGGRYPEPDPDVIEVYLEDDPIKLKEAVRDGKEIKWRNNIVATMERYEPAPISAATLPSSYLHHHTGSSSTDSSLNPEYSYAYCEPMVLKAQQQQQQQQHQHHHLQPQQQCLQPCSNIPAIHKLPSSASSNAISKLPSTNSLRALLSKSFRKSSVASANATQPGGAGAAPSGSGGGGSTVGGPPPPPGTEKHTFTTRYGTKENIYEDVGAGSTSKVGGAVNSPSMQSFESISKFNIHDELRHVQSQHDRIIGELNLSVETLIMPSKDEQDAIEERLNEIHCAAQQYHDEMSQDDCIAAGSSSSNSAMIHMQERLSPTTSQPNSGDVDSGISGSSSSGASYSSSMLYRTTAMYTNNGGGSGCGGQGGGKTVTINDNAEGSGSGMSMMAGSSSIRSSCGSSSGGGCDRSLGPGIGYSSCGGGGASCSKMASNVIPNANKLTCCFYSDKLGGGGRGVSKSNGDQLDQLGDKSSSFWNKLGKLRISGVFGGTANSNSNSSSSSSCSAASINNGGAQPHFHPPHHHHTLHHHHPASSHFGGGAAHHQHHNHTLLAHHPQLQLPGLNHSAPTTTTNTATIARSNEADPQQHQHHLCQPHHHHHLHHYLHHRCPGHPAPAPPVTNTIEPWWQTPPSDHCMLGTCSGGTCEGEYQMPCEVLVPPPQPPPSLVINSRPPLPQPPLQTQIELEEDGEEEQQQQEPPTEPPLPTEVHGAPDS